MRIEMNMSLRIWRTKLVIANCVRFATMDKI